MCYRLRYIARMYITFLPPHTCFAFVCCSIQPTCWTVCGPAGERDKIPLPPKVPSGSHQCYSYLCFWHIFTSQFIFHVLFSLFDSFYVVPPSLYSLLFTCYPLHFIHILLYLYFTFYFSLFDSFTWYPLHFSRFYLPVTPFILWVYFM